MSSLFYVTAVNHHLLLVIVVKCDCEASVGHVQECRMTHVFQFGKNVIVFSEFKSMLGLHEIKLD